MNNNAGDVHSGGADRVLQISLFYLLGKMNKETFLYGNCGGVVILKV